MAIKDDTDATKFDDQLAIDMYAQGRTNAYMHFLKGKPVGGLRLRSSLGRRRYM